VTSQHIGTAAIVSRAAFKNSSICVSDILGAGGIVFDI
jgi:hypothetical protein